MPRKVSTTSDTPLFDYNSLLVESIDEISRRQGFDSDALEDTAPMSTGLLMLDLLYGGGIRPAWYTHFGPEQSAKTTGVLSIVASAIKQGVPMIAFCDYEGSTKNSKPYVANILKTMGVDKIIGQVFGTKDPTTGAWSIPPIIRYRAETRGEAFFDWLSEVLRVLPDKKKVNGKWWLVFEDNKVNKVKVGEYANREMAKKYGSGLWVEAQDGKLQAIVCVDSYPAMNPTSNDEEETDNSLALQARMFSKQLPRVKGRLAPKMVAVIGTNQLRANPMDRYHPEVEPGGTALKFNSDVRCKFTPRASGMPLWPTFNSENKYEEELSVEGQGTDKYRYIQLHTKKNKLWTPNRKAWIRIWAEDYKAEGRGFDPVFDTACYLYYTGQLVGRGRKSMKLTFKEQTVAIKWLQLKKWVLGDRTAMKEVCAELGFAKPFSIRRECFKQMESGTAEKMYSDWMQGASSSEDEDDNSEE
jgi:RecA/RadA recombinase